MKTYDITVITPTGVRTSVIKANDWSLQGDRVFFNNKIGKVVHSYPNHCLIFSLTEEDNFHTSDS